VHAQRAPQVLGFYIYVIHQNPRYPIVMDAMQAQRKWRKMVRITKRFSPFFAFVELTLKFK
jgi:hypothetical protein